VEFRKVLSAAVGPEGAMMMASGARHGSEWRIDRQDRVGQGRKAGASGKAGLGRQTNPSEKLVES
jgi:hypothetical protein